MTYYDSQDVSLKKGDTLMLINCGGEVISVGDFSLAKNTVLIWVLTFSLSVAAILLMYFKVKKFKSGRR